MRARSCAPCWKEETRPNDLVFATTEQADARTAGRLPGWRIRRPRRPFELAPPAGGLAGQQSAGPAAGRRTAALAPAVARNDAARAGPGRLELCAAGSGACLQRTAAARPGSRRGLVEGDARPQRGSRRLCRVLP